MRHFEGFHRNSTATSEISLIALAFQDCLLSELDAILFFKFSDHCFEELKLVLFLDYLGFHFNGNLLFDSAFIQFVAGNLGEELEGLNTTALKSSVEESVAEVKLSVLSGFCLSPGLDESKHMLLLFFLAPLVNPSIDNERSSFGLLLHFLALHVQFLVLSVQLLELTCLLKLEFLHFLIEVSRVLEFDCLNFAEHIFFKV